METREAPTMDAMTGIVAPAELAGPAAGAKPGVEAATGVAAGLTADSATTALTEAAAKITAQVTFFISIFFVFTACGVDDLRRIRRKPHDFIDGLQLEE